jgi:sporulation protein YlmC with PRC-barrel domain
MKLMRDLLDKQVVDRNQTRIGKIDGVVAELRKNQPPRIVCIEIGSVALARRLGPRMEHWASALGRRLGGEKHRRAHRIPWSKVRDIGVDVEFDIDVQQTAIFDWQDWLRRRVIKRIPGEGR